MFKKCKVVMLPARKATTIAKSMTSGKLFYHKTLELAKRHNEWEGGTFMNLYVLSDDKIEANDWCMCDDRNHISENPKYRLGKCIKIVNGWIYTMDGMGENPDWTKKIIATTDLNLTVLSDKSNFEVPLPMPSDLFIKKYCELKGIDQVLVEYENKGKCVKCKREKEGHVCECGEDSNYEYQILPKLASDNTITIRKVKDSYTKEEVIKLLETYSDFVDDLYRPHTSNNILAWESKDEWIEKNL